MHASMQGTNNFDDFHHCLRYQYLKTDKMIILVVAEAQGLANGHATVTVNIITELKLPSLKAV